MNLTAVSREFTMHSRELWGKGYKERPIRAGCVIRSMGAYTATKDRLTHRSTRRPYFWTSLASNLYVRAHYDAKGTESDAFGAEVLAARRRFRYARRNRKPGIVLVGCSTEESRRVGLPFPFGIWSKRI